MARSSRRSADRAITNRWPRMNVLSVLPAAATTLERRVTMRVLGQGIAVSLWAGTGRAAAQLSQDDEAQRDKLLKEITSDGHDRVRETVDTAADAAGDRSLLLQLNNTTVVDRT